MFTGAAVVAVSIATVNYCTTIMTAKSTIAYSIIIRWWLLCDSPAEDSRGRINSVLRALLTVVTT